MTLDLLGWGYAGLLVAIWLWLIFSEHRKG